MDSFNELMDQLKNGEIEKIYVKKEDFLTFRRLLVAREDFKHFRGIADRGGNVEYEYLEEARS
ncbi:hypothetical protein J2S13_001233 [Oikeobacillus pervagus]|uniref:Abortive phage infection protein n=1 Tax=Oikeobacillus pervagus TaxID=1325931 RepID=A0AAJ1T423_9BACI|nr:hypothetical protein [Oikeobacillus pervagus]MDQ0214836.1 hypothetical protein [Oikeobacillus pervagus]